MGGKRETWDFDGVQDSQTLFWHFLGDTLARNLLFRFPYRWCQMSVGTKVGKIWSGFVGTHFVKAICFFTCDDIVFQGIYKFYGVFVAWEAFPIVGDGRYCKKIYSCSWCKKGIVDRDRARMAINGKFRMVAVPWKVAVTFPLAPARPLMLKGGIRWIL